jgi:hypothetical protein
VPLFRKLRSDYHLFFISCNCARQHRCAHVLRLLMCNKIASSGARTKSRRLALDLQWHRENPAPKPGLSSAYLHKFASPDAGPISPNIERKQRASTWPSSLKQYVCTTLFALEVYLEDHHAKVELPALELQGDSRFDKRNVKYSSLIPAFLARKLRSIVTQLIATFHELSEDSCAGERCRNHRLTSRQGGNYVSQ